MKNFFYYLVALFFATEVNAQFKIHVETTSSFDSSIVYLYSLNGSKDILVTKLNKSNNSWDYQFEKPYVGMMKLYFPDHNNTLNFISENKDIRISFDSNNQKITGIKYIDPSNQLMEQVQDVQKKKEYILPALYQIKDYYKADSNFGQALTKEIDNLSQNLVIDADKNPLVAYYKETYNRFLVESATTPKPSKEDIVDFLSKSNYMLESSSLLRPILVSFMNASSGANMEDSVNNLLDKVNIETPRGQVILSELIEVFDAYGMAELKDKFLNKAKNLKCSINDRLASTIKTNKNVELNAKFPNYTFVSPINTKAKSIYDVKADKKIIIFWASTCSHCESEIPVILDKYNQLKEKGIVIIGLSLDTDKDEFSKKAQSLPWINDSELRGWYSSFLDTFNVHATPTYFVLDSSNKIIAKPEHVADVIEFLQIK